MNPDKYFLQHKCLNLQLHFETLNGPLIKADMGCDQTQKLETELNYVYMIAREDWPKKWLKNSSDTS